MPIARIRTDILASDGNDMHRNTVATLEQRSRNCSTTLAFVGFAELAVRVRTTTIN